MLPCENYSYYQCTTLDSEYIILIVSHSMVVHTVYIGIAMMFVSPYIREFSFYSLFHVSSSFDDFTA